MAYDTVSVKELGEATVLNEQGEQIKLSTLWYKKTAVFVFVRHFG